MKIKQELSSIELKYNQNHNREENTDRVTDNYNKKTNLIHYLINHLPKHSLLKQSLLSLNREDIKRLTLEYLRDKVKEILIRKYKREKESKKTRKEKIKRDSKDYLGITQEKTYYLNTPYGQYPIHYRNPLNKWAYQYHCTEAKMSKQLLSYNYLKIKTLIRYLFSQYSKVYVSRLDFHFKEEDCRDLDKVNWMFSKLLKETLSNDKGYLGYICSREYSETEGIHLHCFLFLDARVYRNIGGLYNTIKEKWLRMGGKSVYNREYQNTLPDRNGVLGVIHYHQLDKIFKLIHVSKYFLKNLNEREWLVRLGYNSNRRLLTSSHIGDKVDLATLNQINYNRKWLVDYSWLDKIKLSKNESFKDLIDTSEYVIENQYWLD
nr:MAG TPA: Inovirus Gp2 [Caudoviricetes sp.]